MKFACFLFFIVLALGSDITTGQYNNSRDGNQSGEAHLTQANVARLKPHCLLPTTDEVLTQPLIYSNKVLVTSNDNKVYAYSASCPSTLLWGSGQLGMPSTMMAPVAVIGIVATPVIDASTGVIYVLADIAGAWKLYALNVGDGSTFHAAVTISGSANGLTFDGSVASCRTALTLSASKIFFGCGGQCETGQVTPCNGGWIFCYAASDLSSCGVFATETTSSQLGGIWMSGGGISIDGSGNLWFSVGNGDFNGTTRWGESILKLSPALTVLDYLTPSNWVDLNSNDEDVGSGPVILHGSDIFQIGKDTQLWLSSQSDLGHVQDCSSVTVAIQCLGSGSISDKVFAPIVFANDHLFLASLFVNHAQRFAFNGTNLSSPSTNTPSDNSFRYLSLAYSSNSDSAGTGLLWTITQAGTTNDTPFPGTLRAYNPDTMTPLWDSGSTLGDVRCCSTPPPTVTDGKVFVATSSGVMLFETFGAMLGGSATFGGHLNQ